ncbi:hypothetical protein DXG01_006725 [Tephrocybe rancida]|nr:hypothetical protein DXG01_006725 [Tephrocybe rancida]
MSYHNPLHPPVRTAYQSQFSALSGAVQPAFLSPMRRRVPQQLYTPKSRSLSGRAHSPISFDHPGYSKQGIQMRELTARSVAALASIIQGAGDAVLAHTGLPRITLRILWPGYEHVEWAATIDLNGGSYGPITRAQLGVAVSQHFSRFVERARTEPSKSSEWNLSSSGIRFEHLVLVALVNVSDDIWQAEVAVDLR